MKRTKTTKTPAASTSTSSSANNDNNNKRVKPTTTTTTTKRLKTTTTKHDDEVTNNKANIGDVHIISSAACQAFGTRAKKLQELIKQAKPTTNITIETQKKLSSKPDKGNFIVSVGDKKVVEILACPRPFPPLKALNLEQVAQDVVKLL
jgi:hypothetical protein